MTPHKIMVVEDNSATRRMVCNALQRHGHAVLEAPDGATARALMSSERPRLVLQDLVLPDADGFTLVGELRKIAGDRVVSILAFSGVVSKLEEARASSSGFDDIISKPVSTSRLVPLIEAHLPAMAPANHRVHGEVEPWGMRRAVERASALDALLVGAPDDVMRIDLDGTIRFLNRALPGYRDEAVVGKNLLEIPTGDHQRELRSALARLVATGEPQGFEAALLRPDGTTGWFSTRLGPVEQHGKLGGVVVVSRDVSETKQAEMHRMIADRMASVGALAAGIAHEINNPLASVIANLDMALQDLTNLAQRSTLPPALVEELRDARTSAERVREVVLDLKIFSRADDERRGPVDVHHVLASTLRIAAGEIHPRARVVEAYGEVPLVEANESRLGQVFLNLLVNAAHAIPPGSCDTNQVTITTSFDPTTGHVRVAIEDTGSGIPPEVRPRLFTPLFTTRPVGVGAGLGLAIAHGIITQLGGSITFDTVVGEGTRFCVTLPSASGAMPASMPSKVTVAPPSRRGSVLVIDDEVLLAQAIRRYLSIDHDVTAVHAAREALDLLHGGHRYDVVLCDLMMPQISGMELYAELRALDPAQADRVVFVTGGAFTPSARAFLDTTTNPRLEKPFDLQELSKLISALIE